MIRGAVLGSPISHSLSPVLHQAAFECLGIEGTYQAIEVASGNLRDFLHTHGSGFDYLSLTMPLKEEVLSLDIPRDALTQRIQSGNTLVKRSGSWSLSSTDGAGLVAALAQRGLTSFDSVLILGAGGTARAVAGALDVIATNLHVLGRSSVRRAPLEEAIERSRFQYLTWSTEIDFSSYQLVVNTTPAGAADVLANSVLPGVSPLLFDVIYKPWPTVLAQRWLDCGGQVINGLELLLYQGLDQLEIVLAEQLDKVALANFIRPRLIGAAQ